MNILGIKPTHDGAVSIISGGRLLYCQEMEKIKNATRHSDLTIHPRELKNVLRYVGMEVADIDLVAIDGWRNDPLLKRIPVLPEEYLLNDYDPLQSGKDVLHATESTPFFDFPASVSFQHLAGHIFAAYCTSPFNMAKESSYVMVWDAPVGPQLYYVDRGRDETIKIDYVHYIYGAAYAEFASLYAPFKSPEGISLSTAGKVMAYVAKGEPVSEVVDFCDHVYRTLLEESPVINSHDDLRIFSKRLIGSVYLLGKENKVAGEDMIASFHFFLEKLTLLHLARVVGDKDLPEAKNLCVTGGCALNIKWNSSIRASGIFKDVWVPPFPNDAGNAIGTACCAQVKFGNSFDLSWDVYSGPPLNVMQDKVLHGWLYLSCTTAQLAKLLFKLDEPVVLLSGNAELGPRALGNRSIIAPATSLTMKDKLNRIKNRESYRPVAPMCLEEEASRIFNPGTADRYMIFEHTVNPGWIDRIPAVIHLDGTARLQTIDLSNQQEIRAVLLAYYKLSGIPVLCNTSANFNGKGFFPDVESALQWGGCSFVWSDGRLWVSSSSYTLQQIQTVIE